MRIVCISDTHGFHHQLELPDGDILIHAGDFSKQGTPEEIHSFLTWFNEQAFTHKIFIAGNHDFLAETDPIRFREMIPSGLIYLENDGIELEGQYFWGSPITPWFFDWAFNRHRGEEIQPYWEAIPPETSVLITHGPPYGIRDLNVQGQLTGCGDLNRRIWQVRPSLHLFGHIHEAYGITDIDGIRFVNAAMLDVDYQEFRQPIVLEL